MRLSFSHPAQFMVSNYFRPWRIQQPVVKMGPSPEFRVLIVDDESSVADSLVLVFTSQGYDARAAYSAEQAAEIISQWEPKLVILDVVLPGMNGIDFAIQLKASCPGCRVLLFSGQQDSTIFLDRALEKGHEFTILAKPVHPKFFLEEAARLISAGLANGAKPQPASENGHAAPDRNN